MKQLEALQAIGSLEGHQGTERREMNKSCSMSMTSVASECCMQRQSGNRSRFSNGDDGHIGQHPELQGECPCLCLQAASC